MQPLDKAEIGRRIRLVRKELGLRQWQLAELLDATQPAIHKYERGTLPEPGRILQLARLGNTSVEWILTGRHAEDGSDRRERPAADLFGLAGRLRSLGPEKLRAIESVLSATVPVPVGDETRSPAERPGRGAPPPAAFPPTTPVSIQAAGTESAVTPRVEGIPEPGFSPEGVEATRRL